MFKSLYSNRGGYHNFLSTTTTKTTIICTLLLFFIFFTSSSTAARCFGIASEDTQFVCSGHGNCTDTNKCTCLTGFSGLNCEFKACPANFVNDALTPGNCVPTCNNVSASDTLNVCSGLGNCTTVNTCVCRANAFGARCESCVAGYTASITTTVTGATTTMFKTCEPMCNGIAASNTSFVCSGHGKCSSPNVCTCDSLWTFASPTTSRADCAVRNCQIGYAPVGDSCEPLCFGKVNSDMAGSATTTVATGACSGHGRCVSPNVCQCSSNEYSGLDCSISVPPVCFGFNSSTQASQVCSGHGTCISMNKCNCSENWKGVACDRLVCGDGYMASTTATSTISSSLSYSCIPVCFGLYATPPASSASSTTIQQQQASTVPPCSNHGTCISPNLCSCNTGYTGPQCQSLQCNEGFTGVNCTTPVCFNISALDTMNVCSGHGNCIAPNTCNCSSFDAQQSYGGSMCETLARCPQGYVASTATAGSGGPSSSIMQCEPVCFGIKASENTTTSVRKVCSGHGICSAPNTCTCAANYNGTVCEVLLTGPGTTTNSSSTGSNSTTTNCTAIGKAGYTGSNCSIPVCFGVPAAAEDGSAIIAVAVCSGHGSCIAPDTCNCTTATSAATSNVIWFGPVCNNSCASGGGGSSSASSSGSSSSGISNSTSPLYVIINNTICEPVCFGLTRYTSSAMVCSGHGTCKAPNTCECNENWFGKECNQCDEVNYTGSNCSIPICFGLSENDGNATANLVCSGHGKCVAPNVCNCSSDAFIGIACHIDNTTAAPSNTTCLFGRANATGASTNATANTTAVCGGHGTCIAKDTCSCDPFWTGQECAEPICFGFKASDPQVCNARVGVCIAPNTCQCPPGALGWQCVTPTTSTKVTSGAASLVGSSTLNWLLSRLQGNLNLLKPTTTARTSKSCSKKREEYVYHHHAAESICLYGNGSKSNTEKQQEQRASEEQVSSSLFSASLVLAQIQEFMCIYLFAIMLATIVPVMLRYLWQN